MKERKKYTIKKIFFRLFQKHCYCKLGNNSLIYKPILVTGKKFISIGDNVFIQNNSRIEAISKWNNDSFSPSIIIGDNTFIEQGFHCTSAGRISIGKNCLLLPYVLITNIDHSYKEVNKNVSKQSIIINNVSIGDNCFIGANAKIFPGVTIGKNVIIEANSIVMNDIPDYSVAFGSPAKVIKKYDFEKKEWIKVKGVE